MEFLHMSKKHNGLKWLDIVTLVPNKEEFPRRCEQEDRAMKEVWEERGPTKHKCDLAQGGGQPTFPTQPINEGFKFGQKQSFSFWIIYFECLTITPCPNLFIYLFWNYHHINCIITDAIEKIIKH